MKKQKLYNLDEAKDRVLGKVGTKRRDRYEEELIAEELNEISVTGKVEPEYQKIIRLQKENKKGILRVSRYIKIQQRWVNFFRLNFFIEDFDEDRETAYTFYTCYSDLFQPNPTGDLKVYTVVDENHEFKIK